MVKVLTRSRDGRLIWEWSREFEGIWEIRVTTGLSGFGIPSIVIPAHYSGSYTYCIGYRKVTSKWNSVMFQFLVMISPITIQLSLFRPPLYHHQWTCSAVIPLHPSTTLPWELTECTIYQLQYTQSGEYTANSIHPVENTPQNSIHPSLS